MIKRVLGASGPAPTQKYNSTFQQSVKKTFAFVLIQMIYGKLHFVSVNDQACA
jgi:hypothetical protein